MIAKINLATLAKMNKRPAYAELIKLGRSIFGVGHAGIDLGWVCTKPNT